eukprot:CAMPEP_0178996882 /NCGR_PEP_ID=MMETSP0795-20121207/8623_1 /TAXON_ID=88552 /ORGANISM="Amoebophrya sp., Strain Ameob2" /LENGTH=521 /DNA_ID=CAMNT_0020689337 /DNA_START=80 /DNA_END=1645 /DNA_ORIENTATION=+
MPSAASTPGGQDNSFSGTLGAAGGSSSASASGGMTMNAPIETPRYKNLGFQSILSLAQKANPLLLDTAATRLGDGDGYEGLVDPSKLPAESPNSSAMGSPSQAGGGSALNGPASPSGVSPKKKLARGKSSGDVGKLERQLDQTTTKWKQTDKKLKEEKRRSATLEKELAKIRVEKTEFESQLFNKTVDLSALRKERELDRRAFEQDCRKKETFLKKLLLSKKQILTKGLPVRPATASLANPGGVHLDELKLERRPLSALKPAVPLGGDVETAGVGGQQEEVTSPRSATQTAAETQDSLLQSVWQSAGGGSASSGAGSKSRPGSRGGRGGGSAAGANKLSVAQWGKEIDDALSEVPLFTEKDTNFLVDEFRKLDSRYKGGQGDRAEMAKMQSELAMLSEKSDNLETESKKARDMQQKFSLEKKKLEDNVKHSKSMASKIAERNGLEEQQNDRVRKVVRKHEDHIEFLKQKLSEECKSRDASIKELQSENSSLRNMVEGDQRWLVAVYFSVAVYFTEQEGREE